MCDSELLDLGDELQVECLWFCFSGVLQEHLDTVKFHWNTHRIHPSRHGTVPGIPNVLYHLPDHTGGIECKCPLPVSRLITEVESVIGTDDADIKQLLDEVEHDIMNYQNRGLCYLPKPKAEADNTDTRF